MQKIILPQDQVDHIINLYNSKNSITKISKLLNIGRDVIARHLKESGVIIRKLGSDLRKYPLREDYFDNIDSEDKAYFLGLLFADGCNHRNDKKKISISLQSCDKDILSKFSQYLYGAENLQFIKTRKHYKDQYCLSIHSTHVSDVLNTLGCVARKSLVLKFPDIQEKLIKHFIRGYFDGDGSLYYYTRRNKPEYTLSIVSTKDFTDKLKYILNKELNIHVCDKLTGNNNITHTIYVRGNKQVSKLLDWLYLDTNLYLERKYNKYLELKSLHNNKLI